MSRSLIFSCYSRRRIPPEELLERWLEGARWREGGGAIRDAYFRSFHHHACRIPDQLIEEASRAACRSCNGQIQFSDAEIDVVDQYAPMVGQHTSALSGARAARGVFALLHRSPPAAAAAQRDRVRCDAERQQRLGLLVDAAAAAYPSCRPAAVAKHPPKKARSGAVAAERLFQSPTSRCPETLFNNRLKPRQ